MKKIALLFLIGSIVIIASCKKYLDIKPNNSLVVPNNIRDIQAILDDADFMNNSTPVFGEASSDDYFLTETIYAGLFVTDQDKYTWKPHDYYYPNDWSFCYRAIYPANVCLEQIEKITRTPENFKDWDNAKGCALFLRSYHFLQLTGLFALAYDNSTADSDPGIVLRTTSNINISSSRATVRQTYSRIIDDTKAAATYLPEKPIHPLRPSKAAAYGLLSRIYLYTHQYDSSLKYSTLCLQIKNDLLDYNDGSSVNINSSSPFQRYNKETLFYSTMNNFLALPLPVSGGALIDTVLYASYNANDLRKAAFFRFLTNYPSFKGTYSRNLFFLFSGMGIDEIFLTRAECYARAGNLALALQDLNVLLQKRWKSGSFIPVTASSPDEALQIILIERRKELLMRGLRWMDIKRLNKEGYSLVLKRKVDSQVISLNPNDKRYALSIPADVIREANIPQN